MSVAAPNTDVRASSFDDDVDPLGILGARHTAQNESRRGGNATGGSERHLKHVEGFHTRLNHSRDPCEAIDAILEWSKHVRDRVSSRQAHVLEEYTFESRELDKRLARLPPTYEQFRAVRVKTKSRRRQRDNTTASLADTRTTPVPPPVSHPLNFHLGALETDTDYLQAENELAPASGVVDLAEGVVNCGVEEEAQRKRREGCAVEVERRHCGDDDDDEATALKDGSRPSGDGSAADEAIDRTQAAHSNMNRRGGGLHRTCSTRARYGSVTARPGSMPTSQQWTSASRYNEPGNDKVERKAPEWMNQDVPALRRSKIRGRDMVFSLLTAARVEEEEIEELVFGEAATEDVERHNDRVAMFRRLDEARARNAKEFEVLMAEYDPRLSSSRQKVRTETLRKKLPWPTLAGAYAWVRHSASPRGKSRDGARKSTSPKCERPGSLSDNKDVCLDSYREVEKGGQAENGRGDERDYMGGLGHCGTAGNSRDSSTDEVFKCGRGGGVGDGIVESEKGRNDGHMAGAAEKGVSTVPTNICSSRDRESNRATTDEGEIDEIGFEEGYCVGATLVPDVVVSRLTGNASANVSGVREQQVDRNSNRPHSGSAIATSPGRRERSTSPRKKPTLPDPNAINDAVMQDPLNMDHMKDLPGLVGGDRRGLSKLVSETVTFLDPAFPNLEFHRRMAMDRAGYFMPGYKLRVNSPGPAAGAYWLERRQSYRVKMVDPPGFQKSTDDRIQPFNASSTRRNKSNNTETRRPKQRAKGNPLNRATSPGQSSRNAFHRARSNTGEARSPSPDGSSRMRRRNGEKQGGGGGGGSNGKGRLHASTRDTSGSGYGMGNRGVLDDAMPDSARR